MENAQTLENSHFESPLPHSVNSVWPRGWIHLSVFFFGLMIASATRAEPVAQDHILWITWKQRPIFLTNPTTGNVEGIYNDIINYLHQHPQLAGYQKKTVSVNHSRFNRLAQSPDNCYLGWVTYDEQRVESHPITIVKPWAIWTLEENQQRFGAPHSLLSLEKLIKDPNTKVGIIRHFSYSKPVLDLLEKYRTNPTIIEANTSSIEINPRMLDAGRVDVFLGNPGQMQRKKSAAKPTINYIQYGIKEANEHRKMLISCADDQKGKQVIQKVNELISKDPEKFYQQVLTYHDAWVGEVTDSFLEQFNEIVYPIKFTRKP